MHLMISNGDQLYNDAVLMDVAELAAAAAVKSYKDLANFTWTPNATAAASYWVSVSVSCMWVCVYGWTCIHTSRVCVCVDFPPVVSGIRACCSEW